MQGSGYMLHLALLERQFSQHLIFRLRVRLSFLNSDPDRESLVPGIAMDEEMMMRIVKMKESKSRLKILVGKAGGGRGI